ncbi:MAG: transposase [Geminicoccaceae bacterium]|nr:transposase [Geminicoccaceae bacterium]MDF2781547.1 transposase [Geminicoccaceae bacterium]
MGRPRLEVADVFDRHGAAWRRANAGHVSRSQLQVMSAIVSCRTAALGGHVTRCEDCGHTQIAYNSCRNRHCPKCQGAAARDWLAERQAELLPVPYFHLVFTLPAAIADLAYQNKAIIYDLLFRASSEALLTIAADPKHLGARIGITAVLHTWGSAMTHHPHVHMIVPGGGLSFNRSKWISCKPGFFLPVRVLSKLFRRLMLAKLAAAHAAGKLQFFGEHAHLAPADAFAAFLAPLKTTSWFVYSKRPFAGPQAVLAYLARYTHRVAISNRRLVALDADGVTFRYKDYRRKGQERYRTMTLVPGEFIRRFLLHVLPKGFHRIRHYGLFASTTRKANIARARAVLAAPEPPTAPDATTNATAAAPINHRPPCPCCGGCMLIVETFERGGGPRDPPSPEPGLRTEAA